jgi:hypothetical protein
MLLITVRDWTFSVRLGKEEKDEEVTPTPVAADPPLVVNEYNDKPGPNLGFASLKA